MKKVCKAGMLLPVIAIGAIGYCFLLFGQHRKKASKDNAHKKDSDMADALTASAYGSDNFE